VSQILKSLLFRFILIGSFCLNIGQVELNGQAFQGGILAGFNTSQITGDDLAGYNKLSLTFGTFVNTKLSDKSFLQLEIAYLGKGSHKNLNPKDSIPTLYLLRLRYIEVPLVFQYNVTSKLTLETGPSLGVFFGSREEDLYGDMSGMYSSREQFKRFELSYTVGGTWVINPKWHFNIRSANSIFPVRDHDQSTSNRLNKGQYSSCIMGRLMMNF
jgi:hypothetical protein